MRREKPRPRTSYSCLTSRLDDQAAAVQRSPRDNVDGRMPEKEYSETIGSEPQRAKPIVYAVWENDATKDFRCDLTSASCVGARRENRAGRMIELVERSC